jgi:hypothetical protein
MNSLTDQAPQGTRPTKALVVWLCLHNNYAIPSALPNCCFFYIMADLELA